MLKIGILISGRGSNMQALIKASQQSNAQYQVTTVIANDPTAKGLDYASAANIPTEIVNHRDYGKDRQKFEEALDKKLDGAGVQLVCLAGFMRLLTPWFVERWRDRLINIHPSLLPAFPGLHTHQAALDYGAKFTGCTVHFVRAEMDHGPIIIQASVPIHTNDTEVTLAERVLESEHKIYPHAVRLIAENAVNVINEKVFIAGGMAPPNVLFNPAFVSE